MTSSDPYTRLLVPFSTLARISRRIARMSGDEVRIRLSQFLAARWDSKFRTVRPGCDSKVPIGEIRPVFFFTAEDRDAIVSSIKHTDPRIVEDVIQAANEVCEHRFRLLGYSVDLGASIDWHCDAVNKVRAPRKPFYQIRYLDYSEVGDAKVTWELSRHQHLSLLARAYCYTGEERFIRELVAQWYDWWQNNPYPIGVNWASALEVGFRALSWAWVLQLIHDAPASPRDFARDLQQSLVISAAHIERYLSTYFSPNTHILGEGLALFVLGNVLNGNRWATKWRDTGWRIMLREADRQVQPGGMHFEQSSYYHVYALDMFLHARILAEKCNLQIPAKFDDKIREMLTALSDLSRIGVTSRFGDDDGGRLFDGRRNLQQHMTDPLPLGCTVFGSPEWKLHGSRVTEEAAWLVGPKAVAQFAELPSTALKFSSRGLGSSGLHLLADEISTGLFDTGVIGDQGAGHGHADALSLQLSVGDKEVLVDSGTFSYVGAGQERSEFRGTAVHNTAVVDDVGQAQSVGPFRWEALPDLKLERCEYGETFDFIVASHNGYRRLSDPVIHRRSVLHRKCGVWFLLDQIECTADHNFAVHWHVHPDFCVSAENAAFVARHFSGSGLALLTAKPSQWQESVEEGWSSPVYGQKIRNQVVQFRRSARGSSEVAFAMQPTLSAKAFGGEFEQVAVNSGRAYAYRYSNVDLCSSTLFFGDGGAWSVREISTDARLLYFGKEGPAYVVALCDATSLCISGEQMIMNHARVQRYECTLRDGGAVVCGTDSAAVSTDLPLILSQIERAKNSAVVGVS